MDLSILNDLINSTEEAILIIEGDGEISFSNARANELLYSGKSVKGEDIRGLLGASAVELFDKEFFLLTQKGLDEVYFNSFLEKEELNSLRFRIKPYQNEQFILTITALEKSEPFNAYQLYKLLADNAYDINLMYQEDRMMYVSPSVHDFLGYFESEFEKFSDWVHTIHPDDKQQVIDELAKDDQNRISYSFIVYRQKHKKGHYLWFETKVRREFQKDGSILNILTSQDITQRKKVEIALEQQKEFIEELFDTDPNLIFVKDGNGKIIYCNKAVSDLVGVSREEFLSKENNYFPAPEKKKHIYAEMENRVINHGQEILIEEKIEDKNGVVNHFQTLKKPLKTKDGDTNILNISTNINKIKYFQQQNQKAMTARTEFFSAMSHEIRTPMNAIMGMTDLMLKRKPREDQVKLLQALHFSAKNLLTLINDVLDFSKIEAGKIEIEEINFSLKNLIENIHLSLKPRALSKNLSLGLFYDESAPDIVKGDSIKISQILNNLIANAIKFTEKGNVSLDIRLKNRMKDGYEILFEVSDTGIGIENSKLKDIFDPFKQASSSTNRKFGGTGLGLTIVKNLVELLNGRIDVSSEEGEGSKFSVSVPFKKPDGNFVEFDKKETPAKIQNWNLDLSVLYVEDVLTNQYLIEEILKDWGVKVEVACNGIEAIEKVKSKSFDLILMDIQMPEMDGYQASSAIRDMEDDYFKNIPILALTANTSKSTKSEIKKNGMQGFISKPVNIDDLRNNIVAHSKLKDQVNLGQLVDHEEHSIPVLSSISYQQTDQLFSSNLVKYQEFLKKTIEEFELNYQGMVVAINKVDLEQFRRIHHRMKSILSTLNMNDLTSVIDDIKSRMTSEKENFEGKNEVENLKFQFDFVLDSLTNKLSSLKWH